MGNRKELKISELVHELPRLKVFDAELQAHEEAHPFENTINVVDKNTYIGIEVEVENVTNWHDNPYWRMTEDGSLRNGGREFITHPIRAWRVQRALTELFNTLNKTIDFSERTSIHIHMNVRTLTLAQLEGLVLTYLAFEKVLFNFVGKERYENIFCIPLCETSTPEHLTRMFQQESLDFRWYKYTALNLLPINQKGTIEFRHLHGTNNINKILLWINLILCLKMFALKNHPQYIWDRIAELNTSSEYRMFGEEVFGSYIHDIYNKDFNQNMAICITGIKARTIHNPFLDELKRKKSNFDESNSFASVNLNEDELVRTINTLSGVNRTTLIPPQPVWRDVDLERELLEEPEEDIVPNNTNTFNTAPVEEIPSGNAQNRVFLAGPALTRLLEQERAQRQLAEAERIAAAQVPRQRNTGPVPAVPPPAPRTQGTNTGRRIVARPRNIR